MSCNSLNYLLLKLYKVIYVYYCTLIHFCSYLIMHFIASNIMQDKKKRVLVNAIQKKINKKNIFGINIDSK